MDYELAKQLKNAGFPIKFIHVKFCMEAPWGTKLTPETEFYGYNLPTLSELIDQLGDQFHELTIYKPHKKNYKYGLFRAFIRIFRIRKSIFSLWKAGDSDQEGWQWTHRGEGKTPEEAVARLWLELRK